MKRMFNSMVGYSGEYLNALPTATFTISNLRLDTSLDEIASLMHDFGRLRSVKVLLDTHKQIDGTVVVVMDRVCGGNAVRALHNTLMMGNIISVALRARKQCVVFRDARLHIALKPNLVPLEMFKQQMIDSGDMDHFKP